MQSHYCSPLALWAAGCLPWPESHLATPGSPQSVDVDAKLRFNVTHSAAGLPSSNHPQILASHLLGLQGPQQTPACKASSKLEYLNVCCCAPTPGGSNLNHKGVRVHTCVPVFDAKVGTACKAWFFGEICQVYEWPATTLWLGVRGSSLTQEKTRVEIFRVDIPFSLVWLSLIGQS